MCLNCGADQTPFEPIEIGPLTIPHPQSIRWNGEHVPLTPHQRLLVLTLVRAGGRVMRRIAVAEAIGSDERQDPANLVAVQINRINKAFRDIDPGFDAIEAVWGAGVRWRVK